jgi:hypothetical protein
MAAVLKLVMESSKAMMTPGFITQLPWPQEISVLTSALGSWL